MTRPLGSESRVRCWWLAKKKVQHFVFLLIFGISEKVHPFFRKYIACMNCCMNRCMECFLTPFPDRGIPQSGLSAAPRLGRPARASGSSADCATWWSWSPRPDELTVGTSAVPRVVERVAGSCQPIHVIRRQSWITVHISITASPARAPLVARVAKGIVD